MAFNKGTYAQGKSNCVHTTVKQCRDRETKYNMS